MQPRLLLSRITLPTRVYSILKHRIVTSQLPFGVKLTEDHLARELGVSRTPIREALNRLVQDGLVTVMPGRGAFVATFLPHDIVELFEVREALEGMGARLAASRTTKETLARLRRHLEDGIIKSEKNGYSGYLDADREFHEALTLASANHHLSQLMEALTDRIQMLRRRSVILPGRAKKSFEEHLKIIEALSLQDPDLAEERMRTHIRNVKEDLIAAINEVPVNPDPNLSVLGSNPMHPRKSRRRHDGP